MTEQEINEFAEAEEVCRRFLAWDMEAAKDDTKSEVKATLGKVIGRYVPEE
jgi:DNA mismatch repair protein MSH5